MIDCSLGGAFGVLSCQFCSTVLQWACFLAGGLVECDLAHRRSVAVLCMLYKIRCNPMHPLSGALPVPYVSVRVTRGALVAYRFLMHLLAAEPRSTAGLLSPSQYLFGTILVTLCSMLWDWWVSRVGPIPFCWPSCSLPFCLLLFFPFSSFLLWVGIVGLGSSD